MPDVKAEKKIDIRGLICPYTFIKAKLAVESMHVGETLEILLDNAEASNSIPKSMEDLGHAVMNVEKVNEREWVIFVRKEKE